MVLTPSTDIRIEKINTRSFFDRVFLLLFFVPAFIFTGCKNDAKAAKVKALDSLSGALQLKMTELKNTDTIVLDKAISKYKHYRQFIHQNVSDTVTKAEADQLQQFYISGKNLLAFEENRKSILARGSLISTQLSRLLHDVNEYAVEDENLEISFQQEKTNAAEVIHLSYEQQQAFQANLQQFKSAIPAVEALIKSRNNGQLPTIVKDSVPL